MTKVQCPVCGKKFKSKWGRVYCNYFCSVDARNLIHSDKFRLIIEILLRRGHAGMRDDSSFYLERLYTMNWLDRDTDRYYRLSEWGYTSAQYYYPDLFEEVA